MSLRRTTLAFFIFATLGLLGVSLFSMSRILKPHFLDQQKADVYLNLQRTEKAISQRIDLLSTLCTDWASRPELSSGTRAEEIPAQFVSPQTTADLDLVFMLVVDPRGKPLYGTNYGDSQLEQSIQVEILDRLNQGEPLLSGNAIASGKAGLLDIGGVPVIVAAQPVKAQTEDHPSGNFLVVGSLFDQEAVDKLNELLQLTIYIIPIAQTGNQPEMAVAVQQVRAGSSPYVLLSENLISGYDLLSDDFGEAAFLLKILEYPNIYLNGELTINYLVLALIMSGVTFIAILFLLIEGTVLSRLRRLSQEVAVVGQSGDLNRRLSVTRKDELGQLGTAINGMLADLQQAVSKRQESEERFQKLVESMDDVVFTIDRESNQVQAYGKNAARTPELSEGSLVSKLNLLLRGLGDQIELQKDLLEKTYAGENAGIEWSAREDGSERTYYATFSPMVNPVGETTAIVGVSRDITAVKKLEKELRQQANEFGALYETSQLLLSQMDIEATLKSICVMAVDKMGLDSACLGRISGDGSRLEPAASHGSDAAPVAKPLYFDTAPNEDPAVQAYLKNDIFIDNRVHLPSNASTDSLIPGSVAGIPLTQGSRILAILTLVKHEPDYFQADHLKLVKAFANLSGLALQNTHLFKQVLNGRERLQVVSRRLVEVQEEERRQIALELHDEIGQILTGLRLSVDMIKTLPPEQIVEHTQKNIDIISDLISRVRQMSLDLRPSMLDDLGIVPTIIWHIDRYSSQTGIHVNLHQTNVLNRRFRSDIETTLYRVVQEALTNIARHADVKTANIRIWCTEKNVGLQIEDEGKGFDLDEALSAHKSRGLLGMRERVGFVGGQLSIVSQPGQGTSLTIEIPLEGRFERRQYAR